MVHRIAYAEQNLEQLYLIGFRLTSPPQERILYTLVLYYESARNDQNRPLTHDGRIVFFTKPETAEFALSLGDTTFRKYGHAPRKISTIYDIPMVVQLVQSGDHDASGEVVNFLNEVFDLVLETREPFPEPYRHVLHELADYATFSRDLAQHLDAAPDRRRLALDALYWSFGVVAARTQIVS